MAELAELRLQRRAVARHLMALLHADDARLARFRQAGFERRLAADVLQIVVGPANRIGADAYHLSPPGAEASALPRIPAAPPALASAPTLPASRPPTTRRRRRSRAAGRCR